MDKARVIYIWGMNKKELITLLTSSFGNSRAENNAWLDHVSKNYPKAQKPRVWKKCTIARLERTHE